MSGFHVNSVIVDGNLTRDPELRSLPSGNSVCSLRIAHSERFKDGSGEWSDRANFFDVTLWGGIGEWVSRNLSKGDQVVVEGKLKWREWTSQEGQKRQAVDINAFSIIPVPRGDSGGGGGGGRARDDDFTAGRGEDFAGRRDGGDFQAAPASGQEFAAAQPEDDIPFRAFFPTWEEMKCRGL